MATTETDRVFKSYSRNMDQQTTRTPGASRGVVNRRVYEENSGEPTRSTAGRFNRECNESPSATTRNTTSSVTNRFNKMTIEDTDRDDDKGKEEVNDEEMPSARSRLKKDTGARSRGDDNDGENEGDEEDAPKRSLKKATANAGAGKRRKEKKNLREKRRSTGVVIMPGQAVDPSDEQAQTVAKNTAANMADPDDGATSNADVLNYQETIMQLQDELASKVKELDSLRNQMDTLQKANTRLKDENSALLRVVGSLSGTGGR